MKDRVSLITTVLNEEATVNLLLSALKSQTHPIDEIIFVDGGSTDRTVVLLEAEQKRTPAIQIYTKKGNRSLGRNLAITQARNEVIAITDAGCIPWSDWLENLLTTYHATGAPVVAGYYDAEPKTDFQAAVVPYVLVMPDRVDVQNFLPATRSMLLEKRVWQAVGGFDEQLSDNEDFAFAHKMKKYGIHIAFAPDALVTWLPRTNVWAFSYMIFRFARGDVKAGIIRKKVLFLFARYVLIFCFIVWLGVARQFGVLFWVLLLGFVSYSTWAIQKNYRYAKQSWYWLPILQYVADAAVMLGSLVGLFKKRDNWSR